MRMDADDKDLLESVERGEWKPAKRGKRERARYSRDAKATFRKDRRLNIRLLSRDLEAIQKRALAEGLPHQTLIASLLPKTIRPPQRGVTARRADGARLVFRPRPKPLTPCRHSDNTAAVA